MNGSPIGGCFLAELGNDKEGLTCPLPDLDGENAVCTQNTRS